MSDLAETLDEITSYLTVIEDAIKKAGSLFVFSIFIIAFASVVSDMKRKDRDSLINDLFIFGGSAVLYLFSNLSITPICILILCFSAIREEYFEKSFWVFNIGFTIVLMGAAFFAGYYYRVESGIEFVQTMILAFASVFETIYFLVLLILRFFSKIEYGNPITKTVQCRKCGKDVLIVFSHCPYCGAPTKNTGEDSGNGEEYIYMS